MRMEQDANVCKAIWNQRDVECGLCLRNEMNVGSQKKMMIGKGKMRARDGGGERERKKEMFTSSW